MYSSHNLTIGALMHLYLVQYQVNCQISPKAIMIHNVHLVNPLPDVKILALSKLKAFADDKLHINPDIKFCLSWGKNCGKRENSGDQHFLIFPQWFQTPDYSEVIKTLACVVKV